MKEGEREGGRGEGRGEKGGREEGDDTTYKTNSVKRPEFSQ